MKIGFQKAVENRHTSGIFLVLFLLLPAFAVADESEEADEVDHVALATRLVKDGHYDRAEKVLADVDTDDESVNLADYYTLHGLIDLKAGQWADAVQSFDDAIRYGKTDDVVFVYMAQAYWGLQDFEKVVQMVNNAAAEGEKIPNLQLMKAQSQWKIGDRYGAYRTLRRGEEKWGGENAEFTRQRIFLLVELGLYQEAMIVGEEFLKRDDATVQDYLAIGEVLRRNRELERAIRFLELARLAHPENEKVIVQLAHAWVDNGMPLAGAELFQRAAALDERFVVEAAELYRRAGAFQRALYMNAQIEDQTEKFRQRVAILLDLEDYEKVASLESRLRRLGLFDDQSVVYALAYARFKTGDYEGSERLLKQIDDPDLFESATQLRQIMVYCEKNPDHC